MESFYVTLPSNVKNGGTLSRYTTPLPYTLLLPGRWEVALTEMYIPHAWHNVDSTNNVVGYYEGERESGMPIATPPAEEMNDVVRYHSPLKDHETFTEMMTHTNKMLTLTRVKLPQGYYNTIQELLHAIHSSMSPLAQHNMGFKLNLDRTVTFNGKRNAYLQLNHDLAEMLGFKYNTLGGKITGEYASDEKRGLYSAVVYSDIILPQVVGDVQAPVLRFVPIDGKQGKLMVHRFPSPDYVPMARNTIDSIEIDIRTDHGAPIVFHYGKVLCKLHFRPSRQ